MLKLFAFASAFSGAKIWTSDEISRIKIHPKWRRASWVFPTIGGRYQMGMNLDSHIGECYEAELLSLQFNAAPSRMFWMNTHHQISSVPSFHRKVGIFQSDSYCRIPIVTGEMKLTHRICDIPRNLVQRGTCEIAYFTRRNVWNETRIHRKCIFFLEMKILAHFDKRGLDYFVYGTLCWMETLMIWKNVFLCFWNMYFSNSETCISLRISANFDKRGLGYFGEAALRRVETFELKMNYFPK